MAVFITGDHVEVETPGLAFHGKWGSVVAIEPDGVLVLLAEHSRITETTDPIPFPLYFNPWELRVLKHASDIRNET